jgi:hypothetical protein
MAHHVAVFAENKPGRIERIAAVLADAGVNIRAITIATTDTFGVVKLLVDDPPRAHAALAAAGLTAHLREIVAVVMDDRPGGLRDVARVLAAAGVNVEGAYGFVVEDKRRAVLVVEVERVPEAAALLAKAGAATLTDEEIYRL